MNKPISKEMRERVYGKYDHCCAYCGIKIAYTDMQVSRKIPYYKMGNTDCYENYLPACRLCNSYKRTLTVEEFRKKILDFRQALLDNPKYQMLYRFSLIPDPEDEKAGAVFYFEVHKGKDGG